MSYCRFAPDSDVYVYASLGDEIVIHSAKPTFVAGTHTEALAELLSLHDAGHLVPDRAIDRLLREILEATK